jgi:hypothetical protein
MAKLTVSVQNHEPGTTVRDMRKQLARVLAALRGDRPVTFSFSAVLEEYTPDVKS